VGECFFWYWLTRVVLDKIHRAEKWLCVCVCVVIVSYRAWSAERDRADGLPGTGGKPQNYSRDAGAHNTRDGYVGQPPPRQWDNRGGYRPFVPGGMGYMSILYFQNLYFFLFLTLCSIIYTAEFEYATSSGKYCCDYNLYDAYRIVGFF